MDKSREVMDKVLDRKKVVKIKEFRKDQYDNKWMANGDGSVGFDFDSWQFNNPSVKIISTSVVRDVQKGYIPPTNPSPDIIKDIMYVTYEDYEQVR